MTSPRSSNNNSMDGGGGPLRAKKQVGGIDAPVTYAFDEHVFSAQATPADKAAAKQEVVESLRSRILSPNKPSWDTSTSNYDNMQLTGKCYKRTNVNAEVSPSRERAVPWPDDD